MKRSKLLLVVIVSMLFVASQAWAGLVAETYQAWTFDDDDNPAIPEIKENDFGTPVGAILGSAGGPPPEWVPELLGRTGVWKADGLVDITLDIPNQMIRNPYKVILLEIGFLGGDWPAAFSVFPSPFGGTVQLVSQEVVLKWKTTNMIFVFIPSLTVGACNLDFLSFEMADSAERRTGQCLTYR